MTWDRYRQSMAVVALAALLLVGSIACGDDDDAAGPAAAEPAQDESDALCDARDELALTVEMLGDVDVVEGGTASLEQAAGDVRTAVDDVGGAAGAELDGEVDAVRSALDGLEDAVGSLDQADSASAAIESVSSSVADLAAAVGSLGEELRDGCG